MVNESKQVSQEVASQENMTGEQALAEGRGKIELPEPTPSVEEVLLSPLPQTTEDTGHLTKTEIDKAFKFLGLDSDNGLDLGALDTTLLKPEDFFPAGVKAADGTVPEDIPMVVKKNRLGTEKFCPLKDQCNHKSAEYCKQAKLEADHRRDCLNGDRCDCFHPARGIPSTFRTSGGGDGRIG